MLHAYPTRVIDRIGDPNAGRPPREWPDECAKSGYIRAISEHPQAKALEQFRSCTNLGGRMFPEQGHTESGPYCLEIEEGFGALNFGGGNCQIDLATMTLDWACG